MYYTTGGAVPLCFNLKGKAASMIDPAKLRKILEDMRFDIFMLKLIQVGMLVIIVMILTLVT